MLIGVGKQYVHGFDEAYHRSALLNLRGVVSHISIIVAHPCLSAKSVVICAGWNFRREKGW